MAKEAAGIVLLDKDLGVLSQGVTYGRTTYGNTVKRVPCIVPSCPGMRSCTQGPLLAERRPGETGMYFFPTLCRRLNRAHM